MKYVSRSTKFQNIIFLFSLKTKEQPILPKYLPSHLRYISLGNFNLCIGGVSSNILLKCRRSVFLEALELVKAFSGTPEDTHNLKALKYSVFLFNFLSVKVLKQELQRNLIRPFEVPHLMEIFPQKIHF